MMTIYEVLRLVGSPTKAHIIAQFWDCVCSNAHCVNDLQQHLGVNQSNLSKHIGKLLALGVLEYKQASKERFYHINPQFRHQWADVLTPIMARPENQAFACPVCAAGPRAPKRFIQA